jgi:serine/threonine-protein kinase
MDAKAEVTQIGKYPVLGILGVGGMGVVYRATDPSVGREVAIKTLTDATEELRKRFRMEARSGVLNHPNIVTVYDFGEQDGNPYIVMEFVPGDSLENLLRAGRQLTMIEKLDVVHQAALGLGYAHQKGVVHRDIKPANLMVMPQGNVKIVDFGVARLESLGGHTQTGMVIGTFHYISPERLLGKTADGRADIWSLGVILYLLLTGRLPFPGDDPVTLQKVVREPHDPLSALISGYPPALDQVVDRALAKSPIDRYETAEEMAADIEAINEGLKREHVADVLRGLKPLMEDEKWSSIRPILMDLQRLNPQNGEVKKLLREVQEKLARQQKTEQIRQLLGDAEEAVLTQRFVDAIELYNQAVRVDPATPGITEKIEHVRALKEKADKVAAYLEQAREARKRSDFKSAGELVEQALQIDDRNTDLRNERVRIVQEAERAAKERARQQLTEAARGHLVSRQFTEAIKNLGAALEIDPTDAQIQQLYHDAIERQEEQRRRKIIEQIVAEIMECISGEDFERALTLIQRAQERLPGETVLVQLKTEAETRQREQAAQKLIEATSRNVYNLFLTNPQEALTHVKRALEQMPGEPRLLALEERVVEQVKKAALEELKTQYLKRAQGSIDARQFDQAVQILETAAIECGDGPDISSLLQYARQQQRKFELYQKAANATREAQPLLAAGDYEAAIALLQPVAAETADPAVEQLLRQASASLAETVRRVDAVVVRAQALGESNLDQALQMIASQPQDIQQHSRVRDLRTRMESAREQERQTAGAIREAAEALQKRELHKGLDGLETVRRTYGDTPRVSSAIAEFKTHRAQIANEMVNAAIASLTQAIQQSDRNLANEATAQVGEAAEFADAALQANLKKLTKQAGKISPKKQAAAATARANTASVTAAPPILPATAAGVTGSVAAQAAFPPAVPAPVKRGSMMPLLIVGVVVVVLAAAGAAYWFLRPVPAPAAMGILELNATPFAQVVSVTSEKGAAVALPPGDHWTPLRLEQVPVGKYTVQLKAADGATQSQPCDVVEAGQVCTIEMKPIDDAAIEQIVGGAK